MELNGTEGFIAHSVRGGVFRVGIMRFDSDEAAAECRLYATEYQAKAKQALLPSERESFAEIAERFVAMATAFECGHCTVECLTDLPGEHRTPERRLN
jgi:hypothetical protein